MSFTFQINSDVEFNHNKKLLDKAEDNVTELYHEVKTPQRIVTVEKNKQKLDGIGVKKIADINELAKMSLGRNERVILDFGDHYVGRFSIKARSIGSSMDAPLTVKLKFAELPAELEQKSEDYDGWLSKSWMQEEILHLDQLPAIIKLPRRYSFRYVELSVIDTSPKWKTIFSEPTLLTESSANNHLKEFKVKDAELKEIYKVGLKTLEDCMQDVFEDGPKRDRRLWIGDLRLQALANYASFKNTTLVKRCLYLFAAMTAKDGRIPANVFAGHSYAPDDTFLLDYSLFFTSILDDYVRETEDYNLLDELFPIAKKQMDYVLDRFVNKDGSINLNEDYPVFIDWSNDFSKETSGIAVIVYTLKQFNHLLKLQKVERSDQVKYINNIEKIIDYIKNHLFDKERGLFLSGTNHEVNIASQVWMVLAGVFDKKTNKKIMQKMVTELFPIKGIATPYMYHHITEALFQVGLEEEAVKLLKSYWGGMIRLGADTYWEAFEPENPSYSPYGSSMVNSYCHAWSCTPVYLIKKYL